MDHRFANPHTCWDAVEDDPTRPVEDVGQQMADVGHLGLVEPEG